MDRKPIDSDSDNRVHDRAPERLVYVLPGDVNNRSSDEVIDIRELWTLLIRERWRVALITGIFLLASITLALLLPNWYRAEALLAPTEDRQGSPLAGQLGGLASLAGVSMGPRGSISESIATLKSREFARPFIEDNNLLQVFFSEDWDSESQSWRPNDEQEWPSLQDGVAYFHKNMIKVTENKETGLVTLAVEWTDPALAAEWASELVRRLNATLRERTLSEAETNIAYLQNKIAMANVVTLQQAIGRLLESEMQKLMLAQGNQEFAFRVIDAPVPPKKPTRPNRPLILLIGTIFGLLIGVLWILVPYAIAGSADQR